MLYDNARALCQACPSTRKTFVQIARAKHNDIFVPDLNTSMRALREHVDSVTKAGKNSNP